MKTIVCICLLLVSIYQAPSLCAKADSVAKPKFPGGEKELMAFLEKYIRYPDEAQKQKWEGKTLIAFSVNEDGSLSNIRVIKSSWTVLDSEALRVIKLMPKWEPAYENGVPKKEMVVLPIQFDLSRKDILYK